MQKLYNIKHAKVHLFPPPPPPENCEHKAEFQSASVVLQLV